MNISNLMCPRCGAKELLTLPAAVRQAFLAVALLFAEGRSWIVVRGCPVHPRMFGCIPGFYPRRMFSSNPRVVTIRNVSVDFQVSPWGQDHQC